MASGIEIWFYYFHEVLKNRIIFRMELNKSILVWIFINIWTQRIRRSASDGMAIINKNFLRFIILINLLELHKTRTWWSIIRTTPVQCDIVPFGKPNTLILTTQVIGANCLTKCLNATFAKPYLLFVDYIWLHWMVTTNGGAGPLAVAEKMLKSCWLKKIWNYSFSS